MEEFEVYLRDFSKEELSEAKYDLHSLSFGEYTPVRLDGESIDEYCRRYESLGYDELLESPHYDNKELFKPFKPFFHLIYTCSALYEMDYDSYSTATFMSTFVNIVLNVCDRKHAANILGISDVGLRMMSVDLKEDADNPSFSKCNDVFRLLLGVYTTSIAEAIDSLQRKYDSVNISIESKLTDRYDSFNLIDEISNVLSASYWAKDSDGLPIDDQELALDEVELYIGANNTLQTTVDANEVVGV